MFNRVRSTATCLVFVFFLVAGGLDAQPVGVPAVLQPTAPTTTQTIQATTEIWNCMYAEPESVHVEGTTVRATIEIAFTQFGAQTPPCYPFVTFGPLPAGSYTYEVYLHTTYSPSTELWSRQSFVVSAAPAVIPSLSNLGLVVLLFSLAGVGIAAVRSWP